MGAFTLDICKGKSREQLCADYRRVSRAYGRMENIACTLAAKSPAAVKKLPPEWRDEVTRLLEALKD